MVLVTDIGCCKARWERKGKLKKKGLNKDVFKERYFELERDHLYYYKSERTSKYLKPLLEFVWYYFVFLGGRGQDIHLHHSFERRH